MLLFYLVFHYTDRKNMLSQKVEFINTDGHCIKLSYLNYWIAKWLLKSGIYNWEICLRTAGLPLNPLLRQKMCVMPQLFNTNLKGQSVHYCCKWGNVWVNGWPEQLLWVSNIAADGLIWESIENLVCHYKDAKDYLCVSNETPVGLTISCYWTTWEWEQIGVTALFRGCKATWHKNSQAGQMACTLPHS